MNLVGKVLLAITVLGLAGPVSLPRAHAQTAGQLAAQSYAPNVARANGPGVAIASGAGNVAPKGAEALFVTLLGVDVANGFPEMAGETASIAARIENRRVSAADLFAAAADLEQAYVRAGYILVRVSLPPQTLVDGGRLRLVVTDGYFASIDSSALPEKAARRVDAVLTPLVGKHRLTRAELERRLLLAGDTPGVTLHSTLKAGDAPGAAIMVVDGRYDALTGFLRVGNAVSESLGSYTASLGLDANNLLGLGETVYFRASGYPGFDGQDVFGDDPRNRQLAAGLTLPLGVDGMWFNLEGTDSRTHPTSSLGYTMMDEYQRLSTRLGYHWLRGRDANLSSTIGFDFIGEDQVIAISGLEIPFTSDELRVLRLGAEGDARDPFGGRLTANATLSFGLDALGARQPTLALPYSRDGAGPDFTRLAASLDYSRPLDHGFGLFMRAKAQTSFGAPLPSSEQIGIGGADYLSGFANGAIEGDFGAAARGELSYLLDLGQAPGMPGIASLAAPYVFAAAGVSGLEQPTVLENGTITATSFGAGIRFGVSQRASPNSATLSLEYARGSATGTHDQDRFNFSLTTQF